MAAEGGRGGPQQIPRPTTVRAGGPPPWSDWIDTDPALGLDDVRRRLSAVTVEGAMAAVAPDLRRSAVAVLISSLTRAGGVAAGGGSGVEVLLTRRAWTMRTHRGEVSFAGGAEEDGDDFPVGTALREASEEIALDLGLVEVVGALRPLTTFTSDRVVLPVVAVTPERPVVVAEPAEVDAILHVPLAELLHPECYHEERWTWGDEMRGAGISAVTDHPMHFFELVGDTIWGATAAMLHQLLTLLLPAAEA
ncbi:MAG: CoA pyrophosphatase [Microthrixaceae bacterium]|jgi:8-oxo-dGTP pyrophosphatase MutT (NUDIX family)